MSDRDWYGSQGVQFQDSNIPSQPIGLTEQPITTSSTAIPRRDRPNSQVIASEKNSFGQGTLAGLTIILMTLSLQLFFLLISALPSDGDVSTVEDFETAMTVQLWFSIFTVTAQLVGIKLIFNDTRKLSYFLDHDVEVRNSNLNVMASMINKK